MGVTVVAQEWYERLTLRSPYRFLSLMNTARSLEARETGLCSTRTVALASSLTISLNEPTN